MQFLVFDALDKVGKHAAEKDDQNRQHTVFQNMVDQIKFGRVIREQGAVCWAVGLRK